MTRDITAVLIDKLGRIAPEIDATGLDWDADLHEELDIDSMDFVNLVTALGERLQIDIPEIGYPNPRHIRPCGRLLGAEARYGRVGRGHRRGQKHALGAFRRSGVSGARRRRTPVASKMALAMAAATGRIELSPAPPAAVRGG